MADEDEGILWYDPDPRAVLPLDRFHVPRSLQRVLKRGDFEVRRDSAFREVIQACAMAAPGREETWISEEIMSAYEDLFELGFAHSVEAWRDGQLAGGLYGVAINGLFAGESMFSHMRDGSKVALVHLVAHLRRQGYLLLDIQFLTRHLERFGAVEIARHEYKQALAVALDHPVRF